MLKSTYSSRGAALEEAINLTNNTYRAKGLGLVQKIPTPITPLEMKNGVITKAYFASKSTVDFIGAIQGFPVCFDAKETKGKSFPLRNVHEHQLEFMEDFAKQGGYAFLVVSFTDLEETFYVPVKMLRKFWNEEGRKSIKPTEIGPKYRVGTGPGAPVNYIENLKTAIEESEGIAS